VQHVSVPAPVHTLLFSQLPVPEPLQQESVFRPVHAAFCSRSGAQVPAPAPVQHANGVPEPVHSEFDCNWIAVEPEPGLRQFEVPVPVQQAIGIPAAVQFWQVPVPIPVQHENGTPALVHWSLVSTVSIATDDTRNAPPLVSLPT
jgi:hypothetical protein